MLRKIILIAVLLWALHAYGQTFTTVTATNVTVDNGSGTPVNPPSGSQLCFLGVNNAGAAITYTPSGGSPVSGPVCGSLNSSGALTGSLQVANPATASPLGLLYTITVVNGGTTYLTIPTVSFSGTLFNFNTFVVKGSGSALGIGKPHLGCSGGAQWTSTTLPPGQNSALCSAQGSWQPYPPAPYCPSGQAYHVPQAGGLPFCTAPALSSTGPPSGACIQNATYFEQDNNNLYLCKSAVWTLVSSSTTSPGGSTNSIQANSGSGTFAGSAATVDLSGNVGASSVNNVLSVGGSSIYSSINSAISALPSTGGTITTPPGSAVTENNLALGSSTKPVALIMGAGSTLSITGTSGLQVFNASSINCSSSPSTSGGCRILCSQSGTVNSCVSNGQQDGSQEYFNISNTTIDCRSGSSVTYTNGCVDINGIFVPSAMISDVILGTTNNIAMHIHNSSGANGGTNVASYLNLWINCVFNAGCTPLVIDRASSITGSVTSGTFTTGETVTQSTSGATGKVYAAVPSIGPLQIVADAGTSDSSHTWVGGTSGAVFTPTAVPSTGTVTQQNFSGGAAEHAGDGLCEVNVNGNGVANKLFGIAFFGFQAEGRTSNTTAPGTFCATDAQGIGIYNMHFSGHATGVACVKLMQTVSGGMGPASIFNVRCSTNTTTHAIVDTVNGYTTPGGQLWDSYNEPSMAFGGATIFLNPVALSNATYAPAAFAGNDMISAAGIDPSFETGTSTLGTGWTSQCISDASCAFLRDNSIPTAPSQPGLGSYSQKVTVAASAGRDMIYATNAGWTITNLKTYKVTFWYLGDGGAMQLQWHLADVTEAINYFPATTVNPSPTTSWQSYSFTFQAQASGTSVYLRISNLLNSGTGSFWIDGVSLTTQTSPAYPNNGSLMSDNPDNSTLVCANGVCSVPAAFVPSTVAQAAGDLVCAQAADSTIGAQSLTAVSSTSSTLTYTMAAVPAYFYPGQIVQAQGNTTTGYNLSPLTIASVTSTTVTITNASNPGAGTAGGTMSLYCANRSTDALTGSRVNFSNGYSMAANYFSSGTQAQAESKFSIFTTSAPPTIFFALQKNSTSIANFSGGLDGPPASSTGKGGYNRWSFTGVSSTQADVDNSSTVWSSAGLSSMVNGIIQPVVISSSAEKIQAQIFFNATGVASGTYTSGITATGTTGQTCALTAFNNSSTAAATVALTGTNTIAGGTALVVTARGQSATAAPTSATAGNGSATCTGTATISTTLGGATGNAILQRAFVWMPY